MECNLEIRIFSTIIEELLPRALYLDVPEWLVNPEVRNEQYHKHFQEFEVIPLLDSKQPRYHVYIVVDINWDVVPS